MDESYPEEKKSFWQSLSLYMDAGFTFFNDLTFQDKTNRCGLESSADMDDANMLVHECSGYTSFNHPDFL